MKSSRCTGRCFDLVRQFVSSSVFRRTMRQNRQLEFPQFFLFIFATIWLVPAQGLPQVERTRRRGAGVGRYQKVGPHAVSGSPLSARARRWRQAVYSNSLLLVMGAVFLLSAVVCAVARRPRSSPMKRTRSTRLPAETWVGVRLLPGSSGIARCRIGSPSSWPSAPWSRRQSIRDVGFERVQAVGTPNDTTAA